MSLRMQQRNKTDTALVNHVQSTTRQRMLDLSIKEPSDAVKYMPGIISALYGSDTRYDRCAYVANPPISSMACHGVYANPKLELP